MAHPETFKALVVRETVDKNFVREIVGRKIRDQVVVTGFDPGSNTSGGFAEYIRVPADWVVKKPGLLTLKECMIYGTAGFTAAYSLLKLEHEGSKPGQGELLVTGATGGVGNQINPGSRRHRVLRTRCVSRVGNHGVPIHLARRESDGSGVVIDAS